MVKIIVGNIYSKIVGILPDDVNSDLDNILSYKIQNSRFIPSVKSGNWDGVVRLYQKHKGQSFYTGLMSLVRNVLNEHNIDFEILDRRIRPEQNYKELEFHPPEGYQERDYQTLTIDRSLKFTRGILEVATGGGKTMIVSKLISKIKTYPFIFYVLTKDLMEQAHEVMSNTLKVPIGMIGDGKVDIQKISVCTIQTAIMALNPDNKKLKISDYCFDEDDSWDEKGIASEESAEKIRTFIRQAKGVFLDECHHAAARTAKDVLLASPDAYWRFGGSATPKRESGDDIMIQAVFGAKIVSINASYLIKNDYLVRPYIYIEPIKCSTSYHSFGKIYKQCVTDNDFYNKHVADTTNHLVSRKMSVLVLVRQISHGKVLQKMIPNSEFLTGKVASKNRTDVIQKLKNREIPVMIATSLADEGLDIPSLDAVIVAGLGKSSTRLFQRIGRTLRKNKKYPKTKSIVILYSHNVKYLSSHAKRVRILLKQEHEFKIIDSKGENFILGEIDEALGIENSSANIFSS
jgi:superfamily II DNA or RNA helicase